MADNVAVTPGTGAAVATDELTIGAIAAHVQRVKTVVDDGAGTYVADIGGRAVETGKGALFTDPRNPFVRVQVTPTISTGIYAAGDAIGGLLTFASASRATGLPTILEALTLVDKADIKTPINLALFNQTFTASTDNAAFNPSDADLLNFVGLVPILAADYGDFSTNSAAAAINLDLPIIPTGTSVFGQMYLPSGTPTFVATTDLVISLTFRQQ